MEKGSIMGARVIKYIVLDLRGLTLEFAVVVVITSDRGIIPSVADATIAAIININIIIIP